MAKDKAEKVSKGQILAERLVEAVRHIVAMSVPAMLQETGAAEALLASAPHQCQPTQRQQEDRSHRQDATETDSSLTLIPSGL